jgi:pyruvate formate lyase activating enzyme
MTTVSATGAKESGQASPTAQHQGFTYVYIGNVPGHAAENTYCPNCDTAVIKRNSFDITQWNLTNDMKCPVCGHKIPIKGNLYQNNQGFPYALF